MLITQWLMVWSLISSTLVALSASTPLYTWIALEVNTIAFIPMMLDSNKPEAIQAAMKYFFIQAYASLVFAMGPILNIMPEFTIIIAMLMKLGAAPFHNWFPSVMSALNWNSALILSTWQKIVPLCIISENSPTSSLLPLLGALNALIGGLGGMMQTEIRRVLAFSSIGHMGWMLYTLAFSNYTTMLYFLVYLWHLAMIINIMNSHHLSTAKDMSQSKRIPLAAQKKMAFLLMSLGGLPPLLGFLPKLMVLSISASHLTLLPIFLILGSSMNLYYYMNMMWGTYMSSPQPTSLSFSANPMLVQTALMTTLLIIMLI